MRAVSMLYCYLSERTIYGEPYFPRQPTLASIILAPYLLVQLLLDSINGP